MSNKLRATTAVSAGVVVLFAVPAFYVHSLYRDLYKRFPYVDRNVVRKAYKKVMKRAYRGEYADIELTDSQLDELFLAEVQNILNSKK